MRISPIILTLLLATTALAQDQGKIQDVVSRSLDRYQPTDTTHRPAGIELLGEAQSQGPAVTLRQIARWSDADAEFFAPVADLVVVRLDESTHGTISIDQLRSLMHDAGVNLAHVQFAGARSCTVSRSDVVYDEKQALLEWFAGESAPPVDDTAQAALIDGIVVQLEARARSDQSIPTDAPLDSRDLRTILIEDLATRLGLDPSRLDLTFREQDLKTLALTEPLVKFAIEPQRQGNLGQVSWIVVAQAGPTTRRVSISALARAWQDQVIAKLPLAAGQTITESDVEVQRVLVDRLSDSPLLGYEAIVGQQAARDLRPGTVFDARTVRPVTLIKPNQIITIRLRVGTIEITSVATSLETGSFGQVIKARNEQTKQMFDVIVTGPQQGDVSGGS